MTNIRIIVQIFCLAEGLASFSCTAIAKRSLCLFRLSKWTPILQVSINNYDSAYNNESLVGSLSTISSKIPSLFLHLQSTFTLNQLFKNSNLGFSPIMRKFLYPELETKVNNNSDKTVIHNPLLK